jgi:hypothetical protein
MDFSNTKISLSRPFSDYSKVRTLYGHILRGRKFQLRRIKERKYLNVGCGPKPLRGFLNLDYLWVPGIDLCWDITVMKATFMRGRDPKLLVDSPERSIESLYIEAW